jgi:hypothetical protein
VRERASGGLQRTALRKPLEIGPLFLGRSGGPTFFYERLYMAQPVWVLSVDLQTKSATFVSGMGDAARSARGAFGEIKTGAGEMGAEVGGHMTHARHGVMLLGEEFGIHLPRGLTSFISGLGPVGAAMNAAFPFIAIAVGATLLLEHLEKMRQAGEKLTQDQRAFATAVQSAFNALDNKLLEAGIRTDELNHNHMGALKKQLELINNQSMGELVKTFDLVAKRADVVFAELKGHWYTLGIGSDKAKHALEDFKSQYDLLLERGKDKEAGDLLAGTRASAVHVLDMMKQAKSSVGGSTSDAGADTARYNAYVFASNELKKAGVGITEKEVQAQETLVGALNAQVEVEGKVAKLKSAQSGNAIQKTGQTMDDEAGKAIARRMDEERKEQEEEEKLREEAQHKAVTQLQEGEREKIAATREGSLTRLAMIDTAIREEENWGLQESGFYRGLLTERVKAFKAMTDERNRQAAEAGKEQANHTLKMGEMDVQADRMSLKTRIAEHRLSARQILSEELHIADEESQLKLSANAKEMAALDKHDKDYENKLKALQDKQLQLRRKHELDVSQILQTEEQHRVQLIQNAENKMADAMASTAAKSIMSGQNMGQAFEKMGGMMLESALKHLLMMETVQGRERLDHAKSAAAKAFDWAGNPILGAVMGALAFTAVMAFNTGTDSVPGTGHGDVVPAMLTPGEGIVPGGVMDGLSRVARNGGFDNGPQYHATTHVHIHASALDADGMDKVLTKHSGKIQKHFENTVRRMNRG